MSARECSRIFDKAPDGFGQCDADGISSRKILFGQSPCQRAAAEISALEANALLIRETDHFNRKRKRRPPLIQLMHRGDSRENTERAVELACIADRVQMRAEQKRLRIRSSARIAADQIAHGILTC